MEAVGAAVGFARVGSTRESRRNIRKMLSTQDSTLEDDNLPKPDAMRVLRTNSPEWPYIAVGLVSSIVMGASMPVYAILFGDVRNLQPVFLKISTFSSQHCR